MGNSHFFGDPACHYVDFILISASYKKGDSIVFCADPGFLKDTGPGSVSPYDHYIKVILDPNGSLFVILDYNYVVPIGRKIFGDVVTYFSGSDKNDFQSYSAFQINQIFAPINFSRYLIAPNMIKAS